MMFYNLQVIFQNKKILGITYLDDFEKGSQSLSHWT